jgi:hypothetical protein
MRFLNQTSLAQRAGQRAKYSGMDPALAWAFRQISGKPVKRAERGAGYLSAPRLHREQVRQVYNHESPEQPATRRSITTKVLNKPRPDVLRWPDRIRSKYRQSSCSANAAIASKGRQSIRVTFTRVTVSRF